MRRSEHSSESPCPFALPLPCAPSPYAPAVPAPFSSSYLQQNLQCIAIADKLSALRSALSSEEKRSFCYNR